MEYEFKSPAGFVLSVVVVCGLLVFWQKSDDGLEFVRGQLRGDANLNSQIGAVQSVIAYKARYLADEREYWVVVTGTNDWVTKRVAVHYVAGLPEKMVVER